MQIDVEKLRDFYASPLGHVVRRLVGRKIRARWRHVSGGMLLGFGFATPYLSVFRDEVDRLGAMMPGHQGALVWPSNGKVQTVLVDAENLPLPDNSVDHLLVAHGLESSGDERPLLREMWRVLAPGGRLLLVVPNRRGLWARVDHTPFGFGHPYSRSQLEALLVDAMFTPTYWDTVLHVPPLPYRFLQKSAVAWERVGQSVTPAFAGLLVVEAVKEIEAPAGTRETAKLRHQTGLLPAS